VITPEEAFRVPAAALVVPTHRIQIRPGAVPVSGKAIASLIFGILGLPIVGILTGWFAVWFGTMALFQIGSEPQQRRGRGLAIAGIVLGLVDIVVWIVLALVFARSLFAPIIPPSGKGSVA
jgi:hypothetical protein